MEYFLTFQVVYASYLPAEYGHVPSTLSSTTLTLLSSSSVRDRVKPRLFSANFKMTAISFRLIYATSTSQIPDQNYDKVSYGALSEASPEEIIYILPFFLVSLLDSTLPCLICSAILIVLLKVIHFLSCLCSSIIFVSSIFLGCS